MKPEVITTPLPLDGFPGPDDIFRILDDAGWGVPLWWGAILVMVCGAIALLYPRLKKLFVTVDTVVRLRAILDEINAGVSSTQMKQAEQGAVLEKVRAQVENSHTTNMREENDERHHEVMAAMRGVQKDVGRLDQRDIERGREIREMDKKLDEHLEWSRGWSADQEQAGRSADGRIRNIEDTLNPGRDKQ